MHPNHSAISTCRGVACYARACYARALLFAALVFLGNPLLAQQRRPISRHLPEWLDLGIDYRGRGQTAGNVEFNQENDDAYALHRLRLNLGFKVNDSARFFLQGQDSGAGGLEPFQPPARFRNSADLRQAYLHLGKPDSGAWELRLGRQLFEFGEERIFGDRDWSNVSHSWDGARLTLRSGKNSVELISASRVNPILNGFDRPGGGRIVHSAYGRIGSLNQDLTLEPYFVYSAKPRIRGVLSRGAGGSSTVGFRARLEPEHGFDYEVEMAVQRGNAAIPRGRRQELRGWMGVWRAGYAPRGAPWRARGFGEYSYGSGDRDPNDERTGTYDMLFGARHAHMGLLDIVGRQNLQASRVGGDIRPNENTYLIFEYFSFWLSSRHDGVYGVDRTLLTPTPAGGAANTQIGQEVDLTLEYTPTDYLLIEAGAGRFSPGRFLQQARGVEIRRNFLYVAFELSL